MVLVNGAIYLNLDFVESLKGRRAIVNSLKERLKCKNISILDISSNYAKEATLAFCFLSSDSSSSAKYKEQITKLIERYFPEIDYEIDYEEL